MPDEPTPQTIEEPTADTAETDYKAEADKWKAMARKHEQQAKTNAEAAKKLAAIEEAQKTSEQKAADRAAELERRAAEAEARALKYEVGTEFNVPAKLLRYLTGDTREEMEANAQELLAAFTPKEEDQRIEIPSRPKEALRSGATKADDNGPAQLTRDDLKGMKPEEIVAAKADGRLNQLLGIQP